MRYQANAELIFVVPAILYILAVGDSGSGKSKARGALPLPTLSHGYSLTHGAVRSQARTVVLRALKRVQHAVMQDEDEPGEEEFNDDVPENCWWGARNIDDDDGVTRPPLLTG